MPNELEAKASDTAADLKMKIEKAQAESAASKGKPLADGKSPQPGAIDNSVGSKASTATTTEKPQPPNGAADDTNPLEWAKRKGLESPEAIARSLREMESEFHRRNQNKGQGWQGAPINSPPPMPQPTYGPPMYNPPPNPYGPPPAENKEFMDTIGRHYDISPQDVPKLMRFTNDFFEAKRTNWEQQLNRQYSDKIAGIEKENARNSEFRQLMQDPVFKDPQVAQEMHRIFDKDPDAFARESSPHIWAYKEALVNIARRNLQGNGPDQTSGGYPGLPSRPPTETRGGSLKTESRPDNNRLNPQEFADLPLEEKTRVLTQMGVRPPPV